MLKQQSAIEYLTTYGWAILIIAIVLVTLFELGIFTPNPSKQCVLEAGFSCSGYTLNSQGVLEFTLNQQTSNPVNITGIACYENGTLLSGQAPYNPPSNQVFMPIGSSTPFYVQCYSSSTNKFSAGIGSYFHGSIAVYYKDSITHLTELAEGSLIVPVTTNEQILTSGNPYNENTIAIKLTDTTSEPVPSGFQQELIINPSAYAKYGLNANLSNLEFTTGDYGTGAPIFAWIENGASSTATSAIIWLNLPSGITSNGGTQIVYMNFLSNNNPVLSHYTGYAPQLYCASGCTQTSYAQYDNGLSVFNKYQNYAGTNLWSSLSYGSDLTLTQNDGLQVYVNTIYGGTVMTNWYASSPFVFQSLMTVQNAGGASNFQEGLIIDNPSASGTDTIGNPLNLYSSRFDLNNFFQINNGGTTLADLTPTGSYPFSGTESISQGGSNVTATDDGYTVTNSIATSYTNGYLGYQQLFTSTTGDAFFVQYSLVRDYPPENQMPSVDILGLSG